ncbi:MAG: IS1634 family transposase [Solirubrobacterales bacterium]
MHVAKIHRRHGDRVYTSHLIRRSIREGRRVRHETIANVSKLPPEAIEALRRALAGEVLMAADEALRITDSVPAGHAEAVLGAARRLGLARLLDRAPSRERDLCLAMICQRVLRPGSKLATARALSQSTLGSELGVEGADQDDLYEAMDWLGERQERIEDRLARRHLDAGTLVLYDVSSSYFEGRSCPLAELGYSRDGKRGTLQITYGLICDPDGRPIAIEAFRGSLHDDKTLPSQITKLRERFGLCEVVVVSDRGMVTKANLELLRLTEGASWITALKAPQVKKLVREGDLQPSLFDEQNLAEITSEAYPDERLVVCRNPLVAAERARKRSDLLEATERGLKEIRARVEAGTLRGAAEIGLEAGPALRRYRVKKHFEVEITEASFAFRRKQAQIEAEAALDGFYVLRTPIPKRKLEAPDVVRSYKQLKWAERAFRTLKGPLEVRPIHHRLEDRVRAHLFVCMLAYYLEWHLREAWAELTFQDECPPTQPDPVAKAKRSAAATRKARRKRTSRGEAPHSFESLISELARRTRNTIRLGDSEASFEQPSEANELQARALELVEEIPKHA